MAVSFAATFSPDGKWVVTASDDQTARVYIVNLVDLVT
jgi:WD40 repeat protein